MRPIRALTLSTLIFASMSLSGCSRLLPPPPPPPPPLVQAPVLPAYAVGDVIGGRAVRIKKARAAGARALPAAEVWDYINRQEVELRRQTAGTGVDVIRSGEVILLRLPAVSTFDVGKADVRSQAASTLIEIALTLKSFNRTLVDVIGHTDSTGTQASNKTLSERRAQSIAKLLTSRGVSQARVATRGYGAAYPIGDNATETGRAINRRVEIRVVPIR